MSFYLMFFIALLNMVMHVSSQMNARVLGKAKSTFLGIK